MGTGQKEYLAMPSIQSIPAVVQITGRQLTRKIKAASARERALIADDLHSGRLVVTSFTQQQAVRVVLFVNDTFDLQADLAIERLGADRILSALDRVTRPMMSEAAE
jgi:hypothetical protein